MSLKEKFFNQWFTLRRLFLWGNVILLVAFLAVLLCDNIRGWKTFQVDYKDKEVARAKANLAAASNEEEKAIALQELHSAKKIKVEIRQIWAPETGVVDRCITCHVGYDPLSNSSLTTKYTEQPLSAPADSDGHEIHKVHNIEKFGCVVCHGGQGTATEIKAAHGEIAHWEKPLLKGTLMQSSCFKCHDNVTNLTVNNHNYTSEIVRAKVLFRDNGCIGCHQIGGEGGPVSVDLREETSGKPLSRIDFTTTGLYHEDQTLANWIKIHLVRDPASFVPGDPKAHFNTEPIAPSAMPPFLLPEGDADALTAYILGLNRRGISPTLLVTRPKEPRPVIASSVERGRWVFDEFGCAGCHNANATGGIRNYNYQYDVTPNLRRAVATYTRQELTEKIQNGVPIVAKNDPHGPLPPLYMPAWKDKIKGQDLDDLVTYLFSIKE